jgi:hypothetical protein
MQYRIRKKSILEKIKEISKKNPVKVIRSQDMILVDYGSDRLTPFQKTKIKKIGLKEGYDIFEEGENLEYTETKTLK